MALIDSNDPYLGNHTFTDWLSAYVMGGGNVMSMGGTGIGGSVAEAAHSNAFLDAFGLSFADVYKGLGTVNASGFAGESPFASASARRGSGGRDGACSAATESAPTPRTAMAAWGVGV